MSQTAIFFFFFNVLFYYSNLGAQIQGAQTQYTIVNFGLSQSLIGSHLIGYNQEIDTTKKFLH